MGLLSGVKGAAADTSPPYLSELGMGAGTQVWSSTMFPININIKL